MTERLWWKSTDPNPLLIFLQDGSSSERKLRLLACAFSRDLGKGIKDERFWNVVQIGERWTDEGNEPIGSREIRAAVNQLGDEAYDTRDFDTYIATLDVLNLLDPQYPLFMFVRSVPGVWGRLREIGRDAVDRLRFGISLRKQPPRPHHWCRFVRDIFENSFSPVAFSPEWRTDTAIALARTMYESREFSAMPILADALQDAGCDNPDILVHCRDTSLTHVRGCWVVDLVLGKE
jgi:hypothetical protein